jgi:hypothetical protein
MSAFRFRSPFRQNSDTAGIRITLQIPSDGTVFLRPPDPEQREHRSGLPEDERTVSAELIGQLEIALPPGMGAKRCKSIVVGVRTTTKLDISPTRIGEEDVIFERKVEMHGGADTGILLEEGVQVWLEG